LRCKGNGIVFPKENFEIEKCDLTGLKGFKSGLSQFAIDLESGKNV
jgi:hypothetical protein